MPNLRARHFRSNMTEGEKKLWWLLRRKQLSGFRFRRQVTIGPYIADFFCPKAKLIIEVDGAPHTDEARMYRDLARSQWLEAHGCRVIRFWNIDVFKQPLEVTEAIYEALTDPPSGPSAFAKLRRTSRALGPAKGPLDLSLDGPRSPTSAFALRATADKRGEG